jgi:hypothetical protein
MNHPNWSNATTTAFGKVQAKTGSREVPVAARFEF